jgi:hypothetical protein
MPAQEYRAHAENMNTRAQQQASWGSFKEAIYVAPVAHVWGFLYKVQSANDRPIPGMDTDTMPAQEYRARAEEMAKQATLKASLGSANPAIAATMVADVWAYLYRTQLANDRPSASAEAMSASEYRTKAEEMAKQATLKATLGANDIALACALVAKTWAYLYNVQSKHDRRTLSSVDLPSLEAMSATEYRTTAEEMAKQAELKASLAASQPATTAAAAAHAWVYLYMVQSRNDRPIRPLV